MDEQYYEVMILLSDGWFSALTYKDRNKAANTAAGVEYSTGTPAYVRIVAKLERHRFTFRARARIIRSVDLLIPNSGGQCL